MAISRVIAHSTPPAIAEARVRSRLMRAVPTIAAIVVIALCIMAGEWQRSRMHGKEALQAQFDAAQAAAPLETRNLPISGGDLTALRYRPVALDGTFDAEHRILLDNRVHAGRVGFEALAPFVLDDGRVLLVNRGWLSQGASRANVPSALPPAGPVRLQGRINLPPRGYFELKPEVTPGAIWQHLDLARFKAATGLSIMPIVVEQTAPTIAGDNLIRDWPAPAFGIDTHRIYMVQWYAFAAVAAAFWLVTHWRRSGMHPWRCAPSRQAGASPPSGGRAEGSDVHPWRCAPSRQAGASPPSGGRAEGRISVTGKDRD